VTRNARSNSDGLRMEVLDRLDTEVFVAAVARLAQFKRDKICKGLVLAFAPISRWAASERVDRLELLRRKSSIAALTCVISELSGAISFVHDAIQLEDLQLAAFEALGWLAGSESGRYGTSVFGLICIDLCVYLKPIFSPRLSRHVRSHAVASEVIQAEAPAAAEAVEASVRKFPENTRSRVLGVAALSWCQHQTAAAQAGSNGSEGGASEARGDTANIILDSLAESSNGDLQTLALLGFGWVAFSHPPTGQVLLERKGIQLMVAAMQRQ